MTTGWHREEQHFKCAKCGYTCTGPPGQKLGRCPECTWNIGYSLIAEPAKYEVSAAAAELTKVAINALEKIPRSTDRDRFIAAYRTLGDAHLNNWLCGKLNYQILVRTPFRMSSIRRSRQKVSGACWLPSKVADFAALTAGTAG